MSFDFGDNNNYNNNQDDFWMDFDKPKSTQSNNETMEPVKGFEFNQGSYCNNELVEREVQEVQQQGFSFRNKKRDRKKPGKKMPKGNNLGITWKPVLIMLMIVIAVILCNVFKEEITEFILMLLSWGFGLLVFFLILKFIFTPRRRR